MSRSRRRMVCAVLAVLGTALHWVRAFGQESQPSSRPTSVVDLAADVEVALPPDQRYRLVFPPADATSADGWVKRRFRITPNRPGLMSIFVEESPVECVLAFDNALQPDIAAKVESPPNGPSPHLIVRARLEWTLDVEIALRTRERAVEVEAAFLLMPQSARDYEIGAAIDREIDGIEADPKSIEAADALRARLEDIALRASEVGDAERSYVNAVVRYRLAKLAADRGADDLSVRFSREGSAIEARISPATAARSLGHRLFRVQGLMKLNRLAEALAESKSLRDLATSRLPLASPARLQALTLHAQLLFRSDRVGEAAADFEAAVSLVESQHPGQLVVALMLRGDWAAALRDAGASARALEIERDAIDRAETAGIADHPLLFAIRTNHARGHLAIGNADRARETMARALDAWRNSGRPETRDTIKARCDYGTMLVDSGKILEATRIIRDAVRRLEQDAAAESVDVIDAKQQLAAVLRRSGDDEEADDLEAEAAAMARRVYAEDHSLRLIAEYNEAATLSHEAAARRLAALLPRMERRFGRRHAFTTRTRLSTAQALIDADPNGPAAPVVALLLESFDAVGAAARELLFAGAAEPGSAALVEMQEALNLALSTLLASSTAGDPAPARAALFALEGSRCIDLARGDFARVVGALDPAKRATVDAARAAAATAAGELAAATKGLESKGGAAALDAFQAALRRHETALAALVAVAREVLPASTALDVADVDWHGRLGEGERAVSYWRLPEFKHDVKAPRRAHYVAVVVDQDGAATWHRLGDADQIESLIQRWRRFLGAPIQDFDAAKGAGVRGGAVRGDDAPTEGAVESLKEAADQAAHELRRRLLDPILGTDGKTRRLVVALDGALNALPLDALADEAGGSVGDRVTIEVVNRLAEIAARPFRARGTGALVVGDVDYRSTGSEARATTEFPSLKGTAREIETIRRILDPTGKAASTIAVLRGAAATRQAFGAGVAGKRIVHVASHGWFRPESVPSLTDPRPLEARLSTAGLGSLQSAVKRYAPMLLCGIAFAGSEGGPDAPGRMTAQEISTLDLGACELAVLSACETSVGLVRGGQGVASLQRALAIAGARRTLCSLWPVHDGATALIMERFYDGIVSKGESPRRALWEAKRIIRAAKDRNGAPLYMQRDWSAWVLAGPPDDL